MEKTKILGFAGSLRKQSFNRALLKAAVELAPGDVEIEVFDLAGIPPFDQDDEFSMPEKVREFKAKIRDADAILIATPEYNYSIPGVLKNAIDWASRPADDNSWEGKPVAIMSASGGMLGGVKAQFHLRQVFVYLNMHALNRPEVVVPHIGQKIDQDGNITDQHTRGKIRELVEALARWSQKINSR